MFSLLAFLALSVVAFAQGHDAEGCYKDFKNMKDAKGVLEKCKDSLGLTDKDKLTPDTLMKNGYDDKCLMKCVMTEMKLVKADGSIDMTAVEADLKTYAPDGKADALLALIKSCAETTAKDPVISKDPCKSIAMTKSCFMTGQSKVCA